MDVHNCGKIVVCKIQEEDVWGDRQKNTKCQNCTEESVISLGLKNNKLREWSWDGYWVILEAICNVFNKERIIMNNIFPITLRPGVEIKPETIPTRISSHSTRVWMLGNTPGPRSLSWKPVAIPTLIVSRNYPDYVVVRRSIPWCFRCTDFWCLTGPFYVSCRTCHRHCSPWLTNHHHPTTPNWLSSDDLGFSGAVEISEGTKEFWIN